MRIEDIRDFVLWEYKQGDFSTCETEVIDLDSLKTLIRDRIMKNTKEAPSLEELDNIGIKPVIVLARDSDYWILVYEKHQVVAFEKIILDS